MNRRRPALIQIALAGHFASTLLGQEPNTVKTEVPEAEVWMGAPVRLLVTLFSPGPFSGTAVFQIPEIPDTLIVKGGSPLVGSETVDGESMITQRHEFAIFTQRIGKVEIPGFPVTYESKNDFLGEPVARSGSTGAVTFESKRPPGTESLPFVLSSATLEVNESWSPAELPEEFKAGEILTRSITREASDTSAMFLMPFQPEPIGGVRIYTAEPEVTDKRERGQVTARRVDAIKYQFERGGTFTIPDITYAWWNPKTEQVEQVELEGMSVDVKAPPAPPRPRHWGRMIGFALLGFLTGLLLKKPVIEPLDRRYQAWKKRRNAPDAVAARALQRACRRNQPRDAYAAWTDWRRAIGLGETFDPSLQEPAGELSRRLFDVEAPKDSWDGSPFLIAFEAELRRRKCKPDGRAESSALSPLNPRVTG